MNKILVDKAIKHIYEKIGKDRDQMEAMGQPITSLTLGRRGRFLPILKYVAP